MTLLLDDLSAFLQEHQRCGDSTRPLRATAGPPTRIELSDGTALKLLPGHCSTGHSRFGARCYTALLAVFTVLRGSR